MQHWVSHDASGTGHARALSAKGLVETISSVSVTRRSTRCCRGRQLELLQHHKKAGPIRPGKVKVETSRGEHRPATMGGKLPTDATSMHTFETFRHEWNVKKSHVPAKICSVGIHLLSTRVVTHVPTWISHAAIKLASHLRGKRRPRTGKRRRSPVNWPRSMTPSIRIWANPLIFLRMWEKQRGHGRRRRDPISLDTFARYQEHSSELRGGHASERIHS